MNIELEYSALWLVGILFLSLFLSWFSYYKKNGFEALSTTWKALLYGVRFLSLFLIGITLLGLFFKSVKERIEPPLFFMVTDNSASMLNYKDSARVPSEIANTKRELQKKYGSKFDLKELAIGSKVSDTSSYNFDAVNSNLEEAFGYIHSEYYNRNIGGIAFVSDGNFNVGANPIYNAQKMRTTPVFCIAVGDSIQKKDQLIRSVFNNPLAFLNNDFPVEIDVSSYEFEGQKSILSIYKKEKLIASQTLQYGKDSEDFQKVRFLLPADAIGYHTYTIKIEEEPDEISYKNNKRNFYIEVLDSRNKVLLLSSAPHPDISSIKNVLSTDENIEFESALFKDWDGKINSTNLLICHTPQNNIALKYLERFEENNIPILYILGAETNAETYKKLGIRFQNGANGEGDAIQATVDGNFSGFVVDPELGEALNYYPPLYGRYGDFKAPAGSIPLLKQRIGSVVKESPLLFFMLQRGKRFGVLMGDGIWKWRINEYQRSNNHKLFNGLINKTIQYLTTPGKSQGLTVRFPKKLNKEEDLVINGVFYNASLEAITSPVLELIVTDENNKEYTTQFSVYEQGYQAHLGKLNPGRYEWEASTKFDQKTFSKSGVFIVEDIDKERSSSVANHSVLKQLAAQSDGAFYKLSDSKKFISDLSLRKEIKSVSFLEDTSYKLIDYTWYLLLCAFTLSAEWFIKRTKGLR